MPRHTPPRTSSGAVAAAAREDYLQRRAQETKAARTDSDKLGYGEQASLPAAAVGP